MRATIKATNLKRFGCEQVGNSPQVRARIKRTNIERHGVEHPLESAEIRAKVKATNFVRYGAEYPPQSEAARAKTKATNLVRWGTEFAPQNPAVREKARTSMLNRYGVKYSGQSLELLEKSRETMLEKYGTTCPWKISKEVGACAEDKVRAWLNSLGFDFKEASLPGSKLMLDGLDAVSKVAFEYNGLFWHCEDSLQPRLKDYHIGNLKVCRSHGIRFLSIFEDEWLLRQEQVKGFLRSALGKNSVKLEARSFLELQARSPTRRHRSSTRSTHIQGRAA